MNVDTDIPLIRPLVPIFLVSPVCPRWTLPPTTPKIQSTIPQLNVFIPENRRAATEEQMESLVVEEDLCWWWETSEESSWEKSVIWSGNCLCLSIAFWYIYHCCFIGAQLGKSLVDKCLSMTWWLRLVGMLVCVIYIFFGTYIFCLVLSDRVSQGADECRGCG